VTIAQLRIRAARGAGIASIFALAISCSDAREGGDGRNGGGAPTSVTGTTAASSSSTVTASSSGGDGGQGVAGSTSNAGGGGGGGGGGRGGIDACADEIDALGTYIATHLACETDAD
jgi:hypothetical protein